MDSSVTAQPATGVATPSHLQMLDLTDIAPEQGVANLMATAIRLQASDLFISANEQHTSAQVRYLGQVEPLAILTPEQGSRYIQHIRAEAGMGPDRRHPQDGRLIYQVDAYEPVDLRVSVVPTLHGDDMAIRLLLHNANLLSLDRLGMTPQQLELYRSILDQPGGMILMTGPTGSGKTVTLYASLIALNDGTRKIHTIEDPVEYDIDGLHQSQVNPAIELSPAELLRGVMRQSPDVIMLGEVRDPHTADAAVRAANSGVLVLTTIHAPTAAEAIQSLRGFGVPAAFVASSLRCVLNARLLRTLCPVCREAVVTEAPNQDGECFQCIEEYFPINTSQPMVRYLPHGCDQCRNTGYATRIGAFEVMPISERMRELILKHRPPSRLRAQAAREGMMTLRQAAMLKAAHGLTTVDEVRRVIPESPAPPPPPPKPPSTRTPRMSGAGPRAEMLG
ncbi:MAG TPA: GspE/PulE family protein [Tepidisphaeraceae bacterium]|jgi:type II secretory ATPase GspE/PulE/Tfp pilus assembly ATPase PilB-like protein